MVREKNAGRSGAGKSGKLTNTGDNKKVYRITMICGKVGGSVTAEHVGKVFKCPSCSARAVVDVKNMKLICDGHSLRKVVEEGR